MVRSLYSGVSGMKAHQSKMDTIGNNISNVNTYGFKSSRVTFSDVFYQATNSASAPSANKGGVNPSEIGYGAILGSVDVRHGTSTMQTTSNALDVGITGEGFFQVQDSEGNTFYTRAGLLDIDAYGNVVDVNGNFVLGVSGSPVGQPASSSRIQISIPTVNASKATASESFNGVNYTVSSSTQHKDANVSMTLISDATLPVGENIKAVITSGGITVSVNPTAEFESMDALNTQINSAITAAYGGTHPGGNYTITMDPTDKFSEPLTGAEIVGTNFGIKEGTLELPTLMDSSGFDVVSVGTSFGANFTSDPATATSTWNVSRLSPDPTKAFDALTDEEKEASIYKVSTLIDGVTYEGVISYTELQSQNQLTLKQGTYAVKTGGDAGTKSDYVFTQDATNPYSDNDKITVSLPGQSAIETFIADASTAGAASLISPAGTIVGSAQSKDLGLGGTPFKLSGGTEGGPQSVSDLTGIAIGGDGIIYGNHAVHGLLELGRLDLVTFDNPNGLTQVGSTYFQMTVNSGEPKTATAGTEGTGAIASACLEMSNVDLSGEMADMITTQRGFQACSRMITVSDTMLEELINLKR